MIDIIKRNRVFWEGTIGGKRLIERLKKRHGHFADVIVADALYLNAPFINTLKENGLEGCPYKLRVVRYHEQWEENGKERERFMWLVTTLEAADYRVLWEMMHRRWDIEENGFHQLKTYYHAKHCYCHDAVETISNLIIIGFNVRELYLYRRSRSFVGSGISRKSINRIFLRWAANRKSETDFIWKRRIEKISRKKPREKIGGILRVLTKNEGQPQMECW